ncbi:hypothetical protein HIMB100_00023390 [SAR116 cluster alpha proteobacterium HIMB100]|nr:hypothetical protein HIMB100_00023390 [SAR116 cluster alpha proteobacterium HIMB100]
MNLNLHAKNSKIFLVNLMRDSNAKFHSHLKLLEPLIFRAHIRTFDKQKTNNISFSIAYTFRWLACLIIVILLAIKFSFSKSPKGDIAHYMILSLTGRHGIDHRADYICDHIRPKQSLNFLHSVSLWINFKAVFTVPNPVLMMPLCVVCNADNQTIENVIQRALTSDKSNNFSAAGHQLEKKIRRQIQLYDFILRRARPSHLLMLDDWRYTSALRYAARQNNIKITAYMHGRFNSYHCGLNNPPFDYFLIWADYFKEMFTTHYSNTQHNTSLINIGWPGRPVTKPKQKSEKAEKKHNLLFVEGGTLRWEQMGQLLRYLDPKKVSVFYKTKPVFKAASITPPEGFDFTLLRGTRFFSDCEEHKIDLVLAAHSTCLMESWLVGIPSIKLPSDNPYGQHLIDDQLTVACPDINDLSTLISETIENRYNLVKDTNKRIGRAEFNERFLKATLTSLTKN